MARKHPATPGIQVGIWWVVFFSALALVYAWYRGMFGLDSWWVVVLLILAFLISCLAHAVLMAIVRAFLFRWERYDFRQAEKCAGGEGNVMREGLLTFWFSWPTERLDMLHGELEASRRGFSELWGENVEVDRPLRIFCFKSKPELDKSFRRQLLNLHHVDGLYVPSRPRRLMSYVPSELGRPFEPERTLRVLFAYYFFDKAKGFLPAMWLNVGVGNVVARRGGAGESARLNRQMLACWARGGAAPETLFRLKPRRLLARLRKGYKQVDFAFYQQYSGQACSVVEYLCGAAAPQERRQPFRAFLHDLRKRDHYERVFVKHFGYNFERLLADWKKWVEDQGLGPHQPPSPKIRKALLDWVVPFVADPDADLSERILAIRDMGIAGFLAGADTLIGLLKKPNAELRQEAQWALENISGICCGQNVDRWQQWWDGLPDEPVPVDA